MLWQCTTCGACENQCPVGIEHLPILIGARRGLVSNGDAPDYLGAMYNNLERRSNIWGLGYDQRQKFVESASLETFDATKHDVLVWLGCAGSFDADFQKSLRSLFEILRARSVKFGVLSKERCTGDPAKRTGNEYMFQELANGEHRRSQGVGPEDHRDVVPALREDDRRRLSEVRLRSGDRPFVGVRREAHPRASVRRWLAKWSPSTTRAISGATPARSTSRAICSTRFGADIKEPVRNRDNPYCCGAGGGLLFADKEEEPGTRISDVRFKQLQDTGANTVVTACPFCSIMLKGAQASARSRHAVRRSDDLCERQIAGGEGVRRGEGVTG